MSICADCKYSNIWPDSLRSPTTPNRCLCPEIATEIDVVTGRRVGVICEEYRKGKFMCEKYKACDEKINYKPLVGGFFPKTWLQVFVVFAIIGLVLHWCFPV